MNGSAEKPAPRICARIARATHARDSSVLHTRFLPGEVDREVCSPVLWRPDPTQWATEPAAVFRTIEAQLATLCDEDDFTRRPNSSRRKATSGIRWFHRMSAVPALTHVTAPGRPVY